MNNFCFFVSSLCFLCLLCCAVVVRKRTKQPARQTITTSNSSEPADTKLCQLSFPLCLIIALLLPVADAADFAEVEPGRQFSFPQDHNLHEGFQSEWWYVTANLQGDDGLSYGAQFTFFSNTLMVANQPQRIFLAHAALSTPTGFYHAERYAKANMGHAGLQQKPWRLFLDHWQFNGSNEAPLPGELVVSEPQFAYQLKLSDSPYFLQGEKGFSKKNHSGSLASYYYNAPFIKIDGILYFADKSVKVRGDAWFDREWSSNVLQGQKLGKTGGGNVGWDWLALHLDDKTALMLYRIRSGGETYLSGVLMTASGDQTPLAAGVIDWQATLWKTFKGQKYPLHWQLKIPDHNINLTLSPINDEQFMDGSIAYWEGAVQTDGSHTVRGYLEVFGPE